MSRKNKQSFFWGIRHMAIARKITLLYSGIFTFSILVISFFMTINITGIQQHIIRRELTITISNIDAYLQQGKSLNNDALRDLLDNKYVEVNVYSKKENAYYFSHFGEEPLLMQLRETNFPPSEGIFAKKDDFYDQDQQTLAQDEFKISVQKEKVENCTEYILENNNRQQIMLISTVIPTQGGQYQVEA